MRRSAPAASSAAAEPACVCNRRGILELEGADVHGAGEAREACAALIECQRVAVLVHGQGIAAGV